MKIIHTIFTLLIAFSFQISFADDQAILTVTGNITKTNQPDKKSFVFSFDELNKLSNTVVRTQTIWTPTSDFKGSLIRDILSAVGANPDAKNVEVRTEHNYVVTIPISDFKQWEVILAYSQNGQRLTKMTKGPLWVIYPIDQYKSELNNNLTRTKFAWNVKKIVVN